MDARALSIFTLLICGCASQNAELETDKNVTSDPAKQCVTARNVSGVCVLRNICDYGTAAIDMTMFATHHYTRTCAMEEVCCPPFAIVQLETNTNTNTNSNTTAMDSDEDD